ncbi:MAG: hypothetical protein JWO04_1413, partial [Gammaproteobacteria bacterium]|nr:hypothetical protein [Gammaproteobacteria bacterium]
MPSISKRVGRHGAVTYLAQARVLGGGSMSKTFEDRATAKAWATKQEAEFKHQRQRGAPVRLDVGQLTIEKLARDYLDDDVTKAQRSLSETQRLIGWWVNKYGSRKVLDISSVMLREARKKLQDEGRGPATTNRHLSAMRACWNWGVQAEYIPETRSWPKKLMLKEPGGRVRFLSDAELAAVLKVTDEEPVTQATIMVSVGTGIRLGEMLRLKWDDIDLTGKHSPTGTPRLSVWVTKTDKPRAVFLPDAVVEALK